MKKSKLISNVASVLFTGCLMGAGSLSATTSPPSEIDHERDDDVTTIKTFQDMRDVRFCEIFFIRHKGEMNELHVYNPSGLNDMRSTGDSCPDDLLNKVDLPALKSHYQLDGIYLNKPRHWMFDSNKLPVGKIRNTNGMDWYWMAVSHMPANVKIEPGFLT